MLGTKIRIGSIVRSTNVASREGQASTLKKHVRVHSGPAETIGNAFLFDEFGLAID